MHLIEEPQFSAHESCNLKNPDSVSPCCGRSGASVGTDRIFPCVLRQRSSAGLKKKQQKKAVLRAICPSAKWVLGAVMPPTDGSGYWPQVPSPLPSIEGKPGGRCRRACGAEGREEAGLSWGAGEDLADFASFRHGDIGFTDRLQEFFFEFLSLPPLTVNIFSKKSSNWDKTNFWSIWISSSVFSDSILNPFPPSLFFSTFHTFLPGLLLASCDPLYVCTVPILSQS